MFKRFQKRLLINIMIVLLSLQACSHKANNKRITPKTSLLSIIPIALAYEGYQRYSQRSIHEIFNSGRLLSGLDFFKITNQNMG